MKSGDAEEAGKKQRSPQDPQAINFTSLGPRDRHTGHQHSISNDGISRTNMASCPLFSKTSSVNYKAAVGVLAFTPGYGLEELGEKNGLSRKAAQLDETVLKKQTRNVKKQNCIRHFERRQNQEKQYAPKGMRRAVEKQENSKTNCNRKVIMQPTTRRAVKKQENLETKIAIAKSLCTRKRGVQPRNKRARRKKERTVEKENASTWTSLYTR